ncbi:unnamed protein product [Paramecium octaurelia]|uniref:Uncharacterized protein n=1 Tax=Paramecium octaurelia TaxID=43137 RepID=A0A8S1YHP1_PAROT|nr:unnamed protein product [Paramecium octaurelia]
MSSLFLTTSNDSFLRLESFNLLQRPKYLQKSKDIQMEFCCKMKPLNIIIISGCLDQSIKFWSKLLNSSWECFQTMQEIKGRSVISQEIFGSILVIEQQQKLNCLVIIKIQLNRLGKVFLSYISEDQFVFQPQNFLILQFHTSNKETRENKHSQNLSENYIGIIARENSRLPILYNFSIGVILMQAV